MQKDPDLSPVERLAIHELISLYGHLIDQRQFSQLGRIFTDDAVFDLGKYDGSCYRGLPAIQAMMLASSEHPLAHHATNIVVLTQPGRYRSHFQGNRCRRGWAGRQCHLQRSPGAYTAGMAHSGTLLRVASA